MSHVRCPLLRRADVPNELWAPFPVHSCHSATPSPLTMTVSSSPLLTWSHSHQHPCHNGVWSVKTFNWEAPSFGPRHFQTIQTGDMWLSLHLMSKPTWAAWRCSNAICSFPFMLNLQINKSQEVQWLQALWKHNTITRPDGPAVSCWQSASPTFPKVHCVITLLTVTFCPEGYLLSDLHYSVIHVLVSNQIPRVCFYPALKPGDPLEFCRRA